jgi:AcrR family transcriptional regulator
MTAKRSYTKRRRAESEQETRDRIVAALMALHEEVGPARTTVSAVAERAGVQRLTVYRHFPDERSMLQACSSRWEELNPVPVLAASETSAASAIREMYEWYRGHEAMLSNVHRDAQTMPGVREALQGIEGALDALASKLDRRYPRRSADRQRTIRHALAFSTWQSLSALSGDDRKSAALALRWIDACG